MQQNSSFLLLFLSLFLLPLIFSASRTDALAGTWKPIENIKDPHVTEIAEFAVGEYNKQSKTSLQLETVVKGEIQVVSGMNYRLVLKAKDGTTSDSTYEAVVWEKALRSVKSLTSFNPVKT